MASHIDEDESPSCRDLLSPLNCATGIVNSVVTRVSMLVPRGTITHDLLKDSSRYIGPLIACTNDIV